MRYAKQYVLALLAVFVVAACAATGTVKPETQNQRLLYMYHQVEAVAQQGERAVKSKKINPAEAQIVMESIQLARKTIDRAKSRLGLDPNELLNLIETAEESLGVVSTYLLRKGAK